MTKEWWGQFPRKARPYRLAHLLDLLIHPYPVDVHLLREQGEIIELVLCFLIRPGAIGPPDTEVISAYRKVQDQVERVVTIHFFAAEPGRVGEGQSWPPLLAIEHKDNSIPRPFAAVDVIV